MLPAFPDHASTGCPPVPVTLGHTDQVPRKQRDDPVPAAAALSRLLSHPRSCDPVPGGAHHPAEHLVPHADLLPPQLESHQPAELAR